MNIPKYPNLSQVGKMNKYNKVFSPTGARIYNAGQRGVTAKPFSKEWTNQVDDNVSKLMTVGSYKKGGIVKKTGLALVHKGELIIPADKVKSYHKKKGKGFWDEATGGRM